MLIPKKKNSSQTMKRYSTAKRYSTWIGISFLIASMAGCGPSSTINGAGASFPASIYQRWFQDLASQGVRVNYQSVGSGAGVRQLQSGTVDFAASDIPMKKDEILKLKHGVIQIPMTAGSIALAYNLQGCTLKLTQPQLSDIFLGKIQNFKQLGCADKPIKVVVRSDGSGTTANFTAHLSAISPEWKTKVGAGKNVKWPTGIGAKGNEGVAAQLTQVEGTIGYVESAFVKQPLQAASLTNSAGKLMQPTPANEQEALSSIDLGPDLTGSNPNPAKGYPIVTFSWILVPASSNGSRQETLVKTFDYMLSDEAQAKSAGLGFISLPANILARSRAVLTQIKP